MVAVDEWALCYEIVVGTLSGVSARDLLLCLLVESVDERGVLGLEVDDEAILWVRPVLCNAGREKAISSPRVGAIASRSKLLALSSLSSSW